jgi:hypothetical protein
MESGSGRRARRMEKWWQWVGGGEHDEALDHETRAGRIGSALVLLVYAWLVVVELRCLSIFL